MKAHDINYNQHACPDETATIVNGFWHCNCPGGPYFAEEAARERYLKAQRTMRIGVSDFPDTNDVVFTVRATDKDHHANMSGWINFQRACIGKLNRKRAEGRGGWNDPRQCTESNLRVMLAEHCDRLGEQDFSDEALADVANFCMMIWNHRRLDIKGIWPDDR